MTAADRTTTTDPVARRFHDGVAAVRELVDANRERMRIGRRHWDEWHDRIAKLPARFHDFFPDQAATVAEIESASLRIIEERDRLIDLANSVMIEKIRQLADASSNSGLTTGARAAADFKSFRRWRVEHLDGIDCDMFALFDQRIPSARYRVGEHRPLFCKLFAAWAERAGIPVNEAEQAARDKIRGDADSLAYDTALFHARDMDDATLWAARNSVFRHGFCTDLGSRFGDTEHSAALLRATDDVILARGEDFDPEPAPKGP
jgi:hypothetical protein